MHVSVVIDCNIGLLSLFAIRYSLFACCLCGDKPLGLSEPTHPEGVSPPLTPPPARQTPARRPVPRLRATADIPSRRPDGYPSRPPPMSMRALQGRCAPWIRSGPTPV